MVPGQRNASKAVQVPIYDHIPQRGWCQKCYAGNWWQYCIKTWTQVKALGVMLDSKLNFNHHVSAKCTKAARQLNALARISRCLSTSSRMIIYNSFINSNFNYCPIVWHLCGKNNGDKIEKIRERALRIIYRNYDSLYSELLRDAGALQCLTKGCVLCCYMFLNH